MRKILLLALGLFLNIAAIGQTVTPFEKKGKWGFVDSDGKVVITTIFSFVDPLDGDIYKCYGGVANTSVTLVNVNGQIAATSDAGLKSKAAFYANSIGKLKDGLIRVMNFPDGKVALTGTSNVKYGFINTKGQIVVPLKYDNATDFTDGLAVVNQGGRIAGTDFVGGKWGAIDITGNETVPLIYDKILWATDGKHILVQANGEQKNLYQQQDLLVREAKPEVSKATPKSDVDINIPVSSIEQDKTFAVIIANENYQRESPVEFARNDGAVFKEYCSKTLGIPDKNIHFVPDATLNNIRGEINWLIQVADAYDGEANIIFYYAGHGIPDESSRSAYLLPIDGYGSDVTTGYKIDDLYVKLGGLSAKMVTVFMDACFSGAQRNGTMLASARGVAIKATQGAPLGNMVVFSAAQGDETAYPLTEQGHGMFTYYMLKKLQETKGDVTLGELEDYIVTNVRRQSIVANGKSQTPTVTTSFDWAGKWKEHKLR